MVGTRVCHHCGESILACDQACAACGLTDLRIWPPPPLGGDEEAPYEWEEKPPSELKMGMLVGGLSQFFVWCLAAFSPFGLYLSQLGQQPLQFDVLVFACPLAVGAFTYVTMRHHHPAFARGLACSSGVTFVFFLAALALWH